MTGKDTNGYCRECRRANQSTRKYKSKKRKYDKSYFKSEKYKLCKKRYRIRAEYGIELEQYDEILSSPCEICGEGKTVLDHDHKTGKIRGPLCETCNRGIGNFKDSENLLLKAAQYLRDKRGF